MSYTVTLTLRAPCGAREAAVKALDLALPDGWALNDLSVYERADITPATVLPPPETSPPGPEPAPPPRPVLPKPEVSPPGPLPYDPTEPPASPPATPVEPPAEAPRATRRRTKAVEPAEAPAPATIAPEDNPETGADPVPSVEDLRQAAAALVNGGKGSKLKGILLDVGASSVSDVPVDFRAAVLQRLHAAAKG